MISLYRTRGDDEKELVMMGVIIVKEIMDLMMINDNAVEDICNDSNYNHDNVMIMIEHNNNHNGSNENTMKM